MKHIQSRIYIFILLAMLSITSQSCRVTSNHGDLDAQWQVMSIELADGTTRQPDRLYYAFFRSVVNLRGAGLPMQAGNVSFDGDKLMLSMPYSTTDDLLPWGMNATETTFQVRQLTKRKMTLVSDYAVIEFRKF